MVEAFAVKRLDLILVERGLFPSRERAQASIIAGEVWLGQVRLDKPGMSVAEDAAIEVRSREAAFSSRGGHKLEKALDTFSIDVTNLTVVDIGASTGGFTDCLLKRGAAHVIAVDVGYGQLDQKLRQDTRVTNLERMNARYLKKVDLPVAHLELLRLGTMDVSFISSRTLLTHLVEEFPMVIQWIILFKPQFEVGREHIKKGGVVRDQSIVRATLEDYLVAMEKLGLKLLHPVETSPISGKKSGNVEHLVHLGRT